MHFKLTFRYGAALAASLSLSACGAPTDTEATADDPATAAAPTPPESVAPISDAFETSPVSGANYGAGVGADANPMAYGDFVRLVSTHDSVSAAVTGTVVEVCQKKGCWMTLQPTGAVADDEPYMVRFKDYGFFMPKTLSGEDVVVEGLARRSVTTVEELRHYAEDAGKSAEEIAAIGEQREEIAFEATGVRVL